MTIRIGNYIFYPAFFITVIIVIVLIVFALALRNILKEKKQENSVNKNFEITVWQRKYLIQFMNEYIKDNNIDSSILDISSELNIYMKNSKYWNVDELMEINENIIPYTTLLLFQVAINKYIDNYKDDAVLILHAIDFINGGMDNPDYFDGEYPWIGEDIPELRNHSDMTVEEARTIYLYESAIEDLYSLVDIDIGKIPEDSPVLDFCKRLSQKDIENAYGDLCSVIDILEVNQRTRDVVAKALFNNISALFADIFDKNSENYEKYVDEYRRYPLRALTSVIDGQLYSDVIESIEIN